MISKYQFIILLMIITACISCKSKMAIFTESQASWIEMGAAKWTMDNGVITGVSDEDAGYIVAGQPYENFVLELDFMPDETVNSGVFIRCHNMNMSPDDCYEMNIWDNHPSQEWRTGSIVLRQEPMAQVSTNGKWNSYKIKCNQGHIEAWINGKKVSDLKDDSLASGYISLQAARGGTIKFRNIFLKVL